MRDETKKLLEKWRGRNEVRAVLRRATSGRVQAKHKATDAKMTAHLDHQFRTAKQNRPITWRG